MNSPNKPHLSPSELNCLSQLPPQEAEQIVANLPKGRRGGQDSVVEDAVLAMLRGQPRLAFYRG